MSLIGSTTLPWWTRGAARSEAHGKEREAVPGRGHMEVGAGFEPVTYGFAGRALPLSYADHVPGFRRARERGKKITALRGQGWCIRGAANPVGGGKEVNPLRTDAYVLN